MRHFKNTYSVEHSRMAASDKYLNPYQIQVLEGIIGRLLFQIPVGARMDLGI